MKGKRTRADAKVREAEKAAKRAAQGNKPKKIAGSKGNRNRDSNGTEAGGILLHQRF
ncbi:MAG: hypothetical protein V8Q40_00535 [Anaerosacchariphilus sp.]